MTSQDENKAAEPTDADSVVIKRYANRKLYNTRTSTYVTLKEIGQMVRAGEDVRIIDYKTQEDITSATLAQIIFEKEKNQKRLSSQALRDIIQTGGEAIQEFLQKRVLIGTLKDEAERRATAIEKLAHMGSFSREDVARLARDFLHASQQNLEDAQRRVDERIRQALGPMTNLHLMRREVDTLKAEVDLLAAKLEALEAAVKEQEPPAE